MNPYLSLLQNPEPNTDYVISMDFVAILNDEFTGFFRTKYTKPDGKMSWAGATQFEMTTARKSFPCFDEPDKKAIFNVKIGRRPEMIAVSNMPLIKGNESFIFQNQGTYMIIMYHTIRAYVCESPASSVKMNAH